MNRLDDPGLRPPASAGRAVVLAIGSAGDVAPLAAVGSALARRGIDTTLMAPARYRGLCPDGVAFESLGSDDVFETVFDTPALWTARHGLGLAWKAYGAAALSGYQRLRRGWSARDTVLVSSSFAVAARLAEQADGFRNTTVHLSPAVLFSHVMPPRWPAASIPKRWPRSARATAARWAETLAVDPVIRKAMRPAFREAGLEPREALFSAFLHSPHRVAYLFPAWFAPAAADWPRSGVHLGFPRSAPLARTLTAEVAAFVHRDDGPLVVATAGTAVTESPWLERCAQALAGEGARVLTLGPYRAPGPVGPRRLHARAVPLPALLPRVDLLAHHGGIGTAADALRHGVAQWLFPTAHDQPDNADRMRQLGVAAVWRASASARSLGAAFASWFCEGRVRDAIAIGRVRARLAGEPDGAERLALAVAEDATRPVAGSATR